MILLLFKFIAGIALIFLIFTLFIGFSILRGFLQLLFGRKESTSYSHTEKEQTYHQHQQPEEPSSRSSAPKEADKKKVFDDDEGEYVDFEEIKDEK